VTDASVLYEASESGTLLRCTAPDNAVLRIGFYNARGSVIGSEDVQPGETRVIVARGAQYDTTLIPVA